MLSLPKQTWIFSVGIIGLLFFIVATAESTNQSSDLASPLDDVELVELATGFFRPLGLVNTGVEGDERLFVMEKGGLVRILQPNGTVLPDPFLDIRSLVDTDNERGLLGLAFHPDYATNGYFYVNYSRTSVDETKIGDTVIARFQVMPGNPDRANPDSELIFMIVDQPRPNHNGGDLHFGPDDMLYVSLGDGGSGNDPDQLAQDTTNLLGTILRIEPPPLTGSPAATSCSDEETAGQYAIPADNPLVNNGIDDCDEIYVFGLRNPWRTSFDRQTGDMFIGDVGQGSREEVNLIPAGSGGGQNFGWRCYEGTIPTPGVDPEPGECGPATDYVAPILEYGRTDGRSITGGYVYRGSEYLLMRGYYFFGDYWSGKIWAAKEGGDGNWSATEIEGLPSMRISSFGESVSGELYVVDYDGVIYELRGPVFVCNCQPAAFLPFVTRP